MNDKNKSIDDIIKESSLVEFLSKMIGDTSNVESKGSGNIGRMTEGVLQELVEEKEPIPPRAYPSYGGGTIGTVDSLSVLQSLMGEQEPVPQDTSGIGRMDMNTLMELMKMVEPIPPR